jgi:hypothetical protein
VTSYAVRYILADDSDPLQSLLAAPTLIFLMMPHAAHSVLILRQEVGRGTMPDYRIYILGADDHFVDFIPLTSDGDDAAKKEAERLIEGRAAELWQQDRKVATFTAHREKPPEH